MSTFYICTHSLCRFLYTLTTRYPRRYFPLTCHGLSQSRGMGMAPNHAPITAPCPGTLTANSTPPIALRPNTPSPKQRFNLSINLIAIVSDSFTTRIESHRRDFFAVTGSLPQATNHFAPLVTCESEHTCGGDHLLIVDKRGFMIKSGSLRQYSWKRVFSFYILL